MLTRTKSTGTSGLVILMWILGLILLIGSSILLFLPKAPLVSPKVACKIYFEDIVYSLAKTDQRDQKQIEARINTEIVNANSGALSHCQGLKLRLHSVKTTDSSLSVDVIIDREPFSFQEPFPR